MQAFESTSRSSGLPSRFAFLADFESIPKWNYAIEETKKVRLGLSAAGNQMPRHAPFRTGSVEGFEQMFEPARRRWRFTCGEVGPFQTIREATKSRQWPGRQRPTNNGNSISLPCDAQAGCPLAVPR